MEVSNGLCDAGEFVYVEYTDCLAFQGGLEVFAYLCSCWYRILRTGGLQSTFGVKDESVNCFVDCDGTEWDSPEASAWASISGEDSLLGYVDSVGVVEIYFVFVVHSCVIGISKLAATE